MEWLIKKKKKTRETFLAEKTFAEEANVLRTIMPIDFHECNQL